ncbi:MAG: MFS transporter [Patescibacteria group bacterium]
MKKNDLLQVLSNRHFAFLWGAQIISQIAFNMLTFVLGIIVYTHTRTNSAVSLLYLVVGLPAVVFGIISGVFVDRTDRRLLMIVSTVLRAILMIVMFWLRTSLGLIYLLAGIVSFVTQFFVPAEASLIPTFVPPQLLLAANALFTMTFYSAIIGGYIVGGPLLDWVGNDFIFFVLAGLFIIAASLAFFLPKPTESARRVSTADIFSDLVEVLRFIRQTPPVLKALILVTLAQAVIAIFATLGPGFADRVLNIKLTDASLLILGPAATGMIVGTLLLGSMGNKYRKRTLINTGILLSGIILVLVSLIVSGQHSERLSLLFENIFSVSLRSGMLTVAIACFFLLGLANSFIDISCNTVLQESTKERMRGRIYGILSSLIAGAALIPVMLSGFLADLFGIGQILLGLGAFLLGFGVYTTFIYKT